MVHNIPEAKLYLFSPKGDPDKTIRIGDARICGPEGSTLTYSQFLLNEMAKVMTDEDIVGIIAGGRPNSFTVEQCVIKVNFSSDHCEKLIEGGIDALDKIFKDYPELVPQGGITFQLRDWEDIPDEEKAGHQD
jgi:hypothetical protein